MTCQDCLSALSTESLREMTADSPVLQHCATCPECARLTTMLRDREYETATVLNGLPPMSNPLTVAETAVRTAQRRRVGRVAVIISGAALAATIAIVSATIVIPAMNAGDDVRRSTLRTETMQLTCLSPQQAADIIDPYVRSNHSKYYIPGSSISAITVQGTPGELAKSRELINRFERDPSAACRSTATRLRSTLKDLDRVLKETNSDPVIAPAPPSGNEPAVLGPSDRATLLGPDKATTAPKKR
jgi:hypothetical protein